MNDKLYGIFILFIIFLPALLMNGIFFRFIIKYKNLFQLHAIVTKGLFVIAFIIFLYGVMSYHDIYASYETGDRHLDKVILGLLVNFYAIIFELFSFIARKKQNNDEIRKGVISNVFGISLNIFLLFLIILYIFIN